VLVCVLPTLDRKILLMCCVRRDGRAAGLTAGLTQLLQRRASTTITELTELLMPPHLTHSKTERVRLELLSQPMQLTTKQ
jgi:hypothetical protein